MDQNFSQYLGKMIQKSSKDEQKKKSLQKSTNHQRTKSYADIHVTTPLSVQSQADKGYSHRDTHPSTETNNIFYSLSHTPTNQKPKQIVKNEGNSQFLQNLDTYINCLKEQKNVKSEGFDFYKHERKTVQKPRDSSQCQKSLQLCQKYEESLYEIQLLKEHNRKLFAEKQEISLKFQNCQMAYKDIAKRNRNMQKQFKKMQYQLELERKQRFRLQNLFDKIHIEYKSKQHRVQRKTLGHSTYCPELHSVSTETQQDNSQIIAQENEMRRKSLKKKAKSKQAVFSKNFRGSGMNYNQLKQFSNHHYSSALQVDCSDEQ